MHKTAEQLATQILEKIAISEEDAAGLWGAGLGPLASGIYTGVKAPDGEGLGRGVKATALGLGGAVAGALPGAIMDVIGQQRGNPGLAIGGKLLGQIGSRVGGGLTARAVHRSLSADD